MTIDHTVQLLRSARVKAVEADDLELAGVFMEAQVSYIEIEAMNARDPHNPYKTRSMHHPVTAAVILYARTYVAPTTEELAEVFDDLGQGEIAERLRGD